jgi:NADPH-dependent 2,4-dienoyl-CoA reductase/sulfur reductase-like enzyme/nitrite reductase/ring-hydroxylating ferredoxin subunit
MTDHPPASRGPDLTLGVAPNALEDGKLLGHVGEHDVLLVRSGADVFAVGAQCTHYNGPLAEGLVVDQTIRCPWHHASFDLRTGEALRAPAMQSISCWAVERSEHKIFVRERLVQPKQIPSETRTDPERIVIIGGGAAAFAAASMLRRSEYQNGIVMLSEDAAPPIDRPNLSKDYLAGSASEDWLPLGSDTFSVDNDIDLRLRTRVEAIDPSSREVVTADGTTVSFDRLLLATGAEPNVLSIPGADLPHVFTLRSLADSRAIIQAALPARKAIVVGAGFIGLEVAASLRARNIEVHVVAPDKRPMERILGAQMADFLRLLHEEHGVIFHLEDTPVRIDANAMTTKRGAVIEADLIVVGIGVHPRTRLAENAGLTIDRGVLVDAFLETSSKGIFAAGDVARWPNRRCGERVRVEHWVVAERMGRTAALNMLGHNLEFDAVPFFWSQHYDVPINYVGHAERWDTLDIEGNIARKDCLLRFKREGHLVAVASIFRDIESLKAELEMEFAPFEGMALYPRRQDVFAPH